MFNINKKLLPIKAHYFFFMAALGPILPQLNVFGRQLGIGADVMGYITSLLPFCYVIAKPCVGFLADKFSSHRKCIFISLILGMIVCYSGFYFIPNQSPTATASNSQSNNYTVPNSTIDASLSSTIDAGSHDTDSPTFTYNSVTFFSFLLFFCLGTIGFNVTNSITDAICFDMLGENQQMKYGAQRVWGTIGFGLTALIGGIVVNYFGDSETAKSITPALIVMQVFCCFDLLCVSKMRLPKFTSSESIVQDILGLLKQPQIVLFLCFATIAGIIDSFIIYYMFWHLEDLAEQTGHMSQIKLIEGCVVAAECLGGEVLFFLISGKIIKTIGYVHCLSFCFLMYSIRLFLIAVISNPWYLVAIELALQGASYALCYTCIVAYASAISPPGTSATVQGLVAGMDDGVGFAIGSLIGGQMFSRLGGAYSFKCFAIAAFVVCMAHIILRSASTLCIPSGDDRNKDYVLPTEQKLAMRNGAVDNNVLP